MSGSLPNPILLKYKNGCSIFFETGTSHGDTVQTAIECGFEEVYSVETDENLCSEVINRFKKSTTPVYIYHSSSEQALGSVLPYLESSILFWLDAHPDCGSGCTPILEELKAIKGYKHPIVIMIDDMRLMDKGKWTVTIQDILDKLNEINPHFSIEFEDTERGRGDILVAFDMRNNDQ